VYFPFLFAAMTLAKVFMQDFQVLFEGDLYGISAKCRYGEASNLFRFWFMKVSSLSMFFVVSSRCFAPHCVR